MNLFQQLSHAPHPHSFYSKEATCLTEQLPRLTPFPFTAAFHSGLWLSPHLFNSQNSTFCIITLIAQFYYCYSCLPIYRHVLEILPMVGNDLRMSYYRYAFSLKDESSDHSKLSLRNLRIQATN